MLAQLGQGVLHDFMTLHAAGINAMSYASTRAACVNRGGSGALGERCRGQRGWERLSARRTLSAVLVNESRD